MNDESLRALVPRVLAALVRRGADFATAEDAVQEALITALQRGGEPLEDPEAWLVWLTVGAPGQDVELLLEPAGHPAVRPYREALADDGIPLASFVVDDIHRGAQPTR